MTPVEVAAALERGDIERVRDAMDDDTRSALDEPSIRSAWGALTQRFGELRSVDDAMTVHGVSDALARGEVHDVLLVFARGESHLQVAYRDGNIVGLVLGEGLTW